MLAAFVMMLPDAAAACLPSLRHCCQDSLFFAFRFILIRRYMPARYDIAMTMLAVYADATIYYYATLR